jgi:hypothetical protein
MIEFYNRTFYLLYTLEIPRVRGKELESAARNKLSTLYPGNINDRNIEIKKNGNKKWEYLVFVLDKNTGHTMLPLSPLFVQQAAALRGDDQKSVNVLYVDKEWFDYICLENGAIKSSTAKIRNEAALNGAAPLGATLLDDAKYLCGTETDLVIYCDAADKALFSSLRENRNIQFLDRDTELKKLDIHNFSLYSGKSPVRKRLQVFCTAAVLLMLISGLFLLYRQRENENERNALLGLEQERQQKEVLRRQRETQMLDQLKMQYKEIIDSKIATPFDIAVVIAQCAYLQTRINSATFNGSFFQFEGTTPNSLDLLHKFENHRLVRDARLHQVHIADNLDAFTLSGTVLAETVSVDNLQLPESQQIAILEKLIAVEKDYALSEQSLTPSAFGEAAKALFGKWGCTVSSYQFINEVHGTEVEYSLRGSGTGFFNALHEIKTKHRLWDVRLTQIRNLHPRNLLDIVIRIRTEHHQLNAGGLDARLEESVAPYPIANISRNYHTPTPIPRPAEPVVYREPPPMPTVPARTESVSWLEYIGSVNDDNSSFIFIKNTRTDEILKLGQFSEGNMRYAVGPTGSIIVFIDERIYEISRR